MKTKGLTTLCVAFALVVALTHAVSATGSEYTSGSASGTVQLYYKTRYISNPGTPGPAVAFRQDYGPIGLQLGTHNCSGASTSTLKDQTPGAWMPVATTFPSGTPFCMRSFSTNGTGGFGGTVAWD